MPSLAIKMNFMAFPTDWDVGAQQILFSVELTPAVSFAEALEAALKPFDVRTQVAVDFSEETKPAVDMVTSISDNKG